MPQHQSSQKDSILFVLPWRIESTSGGVNIVVQNLYKMFKKNKHFIPIICSLNWGQKKIVDIKSNKYFSIEFNMVYPTTGIKSHISFLLKLPLCLYRLQKYIKRKNIKVINFHYPSRSALCVAILKKFKLYKGRLVLSYHGTDAHSIQKVGFLDSFIFQNTDNIITCSEALSRTIKSKIPEKFYKKIIVIHHAISQEDFFSRQKINPEILDKVKNKKYILSVAKFDPNKGLDQLIKAFHKLSQENKDINLILVGASSDYLQELKSLAQSFDTDHRILFFEDVPNDQIGMFYKYASVFVLNSKKEGFGLVILEAGLYQNTVLATITGGVPEIIQDNKNGILIPVADDHEILQSKLKYILDHPKETEVLGKALHELVITKFLWEKKYQEYLNLFLSDG